MGNEGRIVFATFFPGCENIHLTKDIGMIPYVLHRDFGYDAYVICHQNGDYPYLEKETPGLKMCFFNISRIRAFTKIFRQKNIGVFKRATEALCTLLEVLPFMVSHGRQIDVLQLFHYKDESFITGLIYRVVNPKGRIYLKLDLHPGIEDVYNKDPSRLKTSRIYQLLEFDFISVESKQLYKFVREKHPYFKEFKNRIYYLPNGVDTKKLLPKVKSFDQKERMILHAGRIGNPQKASEVILEAFAALARDFPGWKLALVGSMESSFEQYFGEFLERNNDIRDRIIYTGFLKDREEVYEYYGRAIIYASPSRFEGLSLASVEAGFFGEVALSSNIPSARDLTDNGRLGYLCPVDDTECFTRTLRHMLSNEDELREKSVAVEEYISRNFDWNEICGRLSQIMQSLLKDER